VIPFEELGKNVIFDTETYRGKLAQLSRLYARVQYLAEHLNIWGSNKKDNVLIR
jgi:hypothetical protein